MRIVSQTFIPTGLASQCKPGIQPMAPKGTTRLETSPPLPGLFSVYFGAKPLNTPPAIQRAVNWYHSQVKPIPKLEIDDRRNHRLHLSIMGEILGLLPPVSNATDAVQQYIDTFNAVEAKAAPGKKDYRMSCYGLSPVKPGQYLVRQFGYHVLVFAPNGAVETFRKVTPADIEIDGITPTNYAERLRLFNVTGTESLALENALVKSAQTFTAPPVGFNDPTQYTRSICKTTAQGLDAWNQPATAVAAANGNVPAYQSFLSRTP